MSSESNNQSFENHTIEHLEHLVSRQGFKIVAVESDGNCFYHAVEKQLKLLNLPNMTHTALRQNLASYLEKENYTKNMLPLYQNQLNIINQIKQDKTLNQKVILMIILII